MLNQKNVYWISTIFLFSSLITTGIFYFVFYGTLVIYFKNYGYSTYIIYPLAIAKIMGSIVILYHKNTFLRELAYAGFFLILYWLFLHI